MQLQEHKAAGHHASIAKKLRTMDGCIHFLLLIWSRISPENRFSQKVFLTSADLFCMIPQRNTEARQLIKFTQDKLSRKSQNVDAFLGKC